MNKEEAAQRLAWLAKEIRRLDHLYYNLATPGVTDAEYDALRKENEALEEQYPDLVRPDSPSHRIGAALQQDFAKVTHAVPMISLEDVFSQEEFKAFCEKMLRFLNVPLKTFLPLWAEPKIDGLSASLIYKRGILIQGATRGDGFVGEDVTTNIRTILDIPLELTSEEAKKTETLEVRGEVYMTRRAFERLNHARKEAGEPQFANPRNAAAGSLRQLDSTVTKERCLRFFAYEVVSSDMVLPYQHDVPIFLEKAGFVTASPVKLCSSWQDVDDFYELVCQQRETLPYDIDGTVFKVDDRSLQARLGNVIRVPRHSVAFKFPAEQARSRLRDVLFQVGRTGVITPVAVLDPVELSGSTVNRATLHNADEMARLDVHQGDEVILQKAGDIIPQIVRVIPESRVEGAQAWSMPERCPSCQRPLVREEDKVALRCPGGFDCPAQAIARLSHFVSRAAFDIEGLGESNMEFFYSTHRVRSFADIFKLKARNEEQKQAHEAAWHGELFGSSELSPSEQRLLPLEKEKGWGPLSVKKLFQAIESRRSIDLDRFIYALGIPGIGKQTATLLAVHYPTLESFLACRGSQLIHMEGIGEKTALDLLAYLHDEHEQTEIQALLQEVTVLPYEPPRTQGLLLSGQTVVFTGTLEHLSRDEAKAQAAKLGAKIGSSVTSQTNLVVVGAKAGRKKDDAERLGIKVLSEAEWGELWESQQKLL